MEIIPKREKSPRRGGGGHPIGIHICACVRACVCACVRACVCKGVQIHHAMGGGGGERGYKISKYFFFNKIMPNS